MGTTLIGAAIASQQTGTNLTTAEPYQTALLAGLLAGLTGAYFNRNITVTVPFKNLETFIQRLNDALSQFGYKEKSTVDGVTTYDRPGWSNSFSGKLSVQIEKDSATISGRSGKIKALQKRIQEKAEGRDEG